VLNAKAIGKELVIRCEGLRVIEVTQVGMDGVVRELLRCDATYNANAKRTAVTMSHCDVVLHPSWPTIIH
jgi:hypothetical protein